MLCGLSDKGRCKQVFFKDDVSDKCEKSNNKNQKRCKRKTIKKKPKENPKISKKKCPKGKILNPKTNRCIIDRKKNIKSKKKICPPGKILNTKTNRCIIDRRLPEDVVINFKYRCKPGYIYNHQSQRCVKKDGPTGKKIAISSVTNTIGGPISIHYYKFKVNGISKHFLLFGDQHTQYVQHTSPEIIEITTLVKKLIRNTDKCIDIFSENPPFHGLPKGKKIQRYKSPLSAMRSEFYGCPVHHMTGVECNYDNLRYHNWDLRFKAEMGKKWKLNPYDELFMNYKPEFNRVNTKFGKRNVILYILGFTDMIDEDKLKKIDKFMDDAIAFRMQDKKFANEVADKDYFQSTRKLIQKEYKKCISSVEFPKELLNTFIKTYLSFNDIDYTLVFTDFYTICRMFMKYDKDKRSPKKCKDQIGKKNTSQYIIHYAGDAHTRNICKFLENMFNVKPVYTTRSNRYPNGRINKLIHINDIRDHKGKKLKDINSVDDLFKDFYE